MTGKGCEIEDLPSIEHANSMHCHRNHSLRYGVPGMAGIVVDRLELQDFGIGGDEGAEVLPGGCSATTGRGGNLPRGKPRSAMVVLRIRAVRAAVAACPLLRLGQALVALCVHRRARGHATAMPECTRIQQTDRPAFRAQRP